VSTKQIRKRQITVDDVPKEYFAAVETLLKD